MLKRSPQSGLHPAQGTSEGSVSQIRRGLSIDTLRHGFDCQRTNTDSIFLEITVKALALSPRYQIICLSLMHITAADDRHILFSGGGTARQGASASLSSDHIGMTISWPMPSKSRGARFLR